MVFTATKTVSAAHGYRPKNVKLPYPIARFAADVCNWLYVNGLPLYAKNAVISVKRRLVLFYDVYNVK